MTIGYFRLDDKEICEPLTTVDLIYLIIIYLFVIIRATLFCFKIGTLYNQHMRLTETL